ncbi:DUF269 domain-containing protein [Mesorhizobium sp. M0619]|uniref:DUF269 domain-containing protein n=1 Tax=unclassified Mesorhizobium TaxID=325217 RepID=UPI00333C7967
MTNMKARGLRTIALTAGRLGRSVETSTRFRFETLRQLAEAGTKLIDDPTAAIEAYPEVGRA